jgi:hypothetical protein
VHFAPRYDPRIFTALAVLDDRDVPMAEVNRRLGDACERLGIPRPSYVHVRRLLLVERERQDAERELREVRRQVLVELAQSAVTGHLPHPYEVEARISRSRGP